METIGVMRESPLHRDFPLRHLLKQPQNITTHDQNYGKTHSHNSILLGGDRPTQPK
jgi:hypothetical protein